MLLAVIVMIALLLIALSVAAPVVARQLRREKEVESQHRMEQYVRALQLYQRKFRGQYPPSIKVLESTNNIRFLRHQYVDPLTGKADYKLIHQGEQKTKIHVFFGQELGGLTASLGAASGMASAGGMGAPIGGGSSTSTIGATSALASGFSGASITTGANGTTGSNSTPGAPGTGDTSGSTNTNGNTSTFGDGTGGVIVGVGSSRSGTSVTEPNGQGTYESWEFWYDPRIEMLKQNVSLTGGGMTSQPASGFGQNGVTGQPNSGATGINGASGTVGAPGPTSTPTPIGTPNPNSSTPNPF
jgi:type II secretory pathway pseudopilin PulG